MAPGLFIVLDCTNKIPGTRAGDGSLRVCVAYSMPPRHMYFSSV